MSKRLKELMAQEVRSAYAETTDCVVIDYQGITAEEANEIRGTLGENNARMQVMRNRIASIALGDTKLSAATELLDGPSALVTGEDIAAMCKVVTQWAAEHGKIEVRGGTLDGARIGVEQVQALAKIPPIEVLYTNMASLVQSPMVGLAATVQAIHRKLAVALEAIRAKKEETQ